MNYYYAPTQCYGFGWMYPALYPPFLASAHPLLMQGGMQAIAYMHQRLEQPLHQQIMNPDTRDSAVKHMQMGLDSYELAHRHLSALLANPATPAHLRDGAKSMLTWVGEWRDKFREWLAIDTIHKLKSVE